MTLCGSQKEVFITEVSAGSKLVEGQLQGGIVITVDLAMITTWNMSVQESIV